MLQYVECPFATSRHSVTHLQPVNRAMSSIRKAPALTCRPSPCLTSAWSHRLSQTETKQWIRIPPDTCDGPQGLHRTAARIERLAEALNRSRPNANPSPPAPTPSYEHASRYDLWLKLLTNLNTFTAAVADIRSCTALVQQFSHSRELLQSLVPLLLEAATLEEAVLTNSDIYTALLPPPLSPSLPSQAPPGPQPPPGGYLPTQCPSGSPQWATQINTSSLPAAIPADPHQQPNIRPHPPRPHAQQHPAHHVDDTWGSAAASSDHSDGINRDKTVNDDGGGDGGYEREYEVALRVFATLAARFLREGYHPADPHAYAVGLRREEKAALLADARRQERLLLSALGHLVSGPGGAGGGIDVRDEKWDEQDGVPYGSELSGGGNGVVMRWLAASGLPPPVGGPAAAAALESLSYAWPSYELTTEELAADVVLADVAAAQWRRSWRRGISWSESAGATEAGSCTTVVESHCGEDEDGEGEKESERCEGGAEGGVEGGTLVLTLGVCAALLQRHPDAVLRQQVYDEGLVPLVSCALGLVQQLRDIRAQQAALYGMYDTSTGGRWNGLAAAAMYGGAVVPGSGYAGLVHLDTLVRDGTAAAAFLTSLAEELRPLVSDQIMAMERDGPTLSPNDGEYNLEYLLRCQAWKEHGDRGNSSNSTAYSDPAAPYIYDMAALMEGVSLWLSGFMGLALRRPIAPPSQESDTAHDTAPYDVTVMLDEIAELYDIDMYFAADDASRERKDGVQGGDCEQPSYRAAALAAVREAAVRQPRRFLAYRLVLTEYDNEGMPTEVGNESRTADGRARTRMAVWPHEGGGEEVAVRWVLLDCGGGGGTRYLIPPTAVAAVRHTQGRGSYTAAGLGLEEGKRGDGAVVVRVAVVVVGLQSAGGVGSDVSGGNGGGDVSLLTCGSEFRLWELMHELGHALHFLLAATAPSMDPVLPYIDDAELTVAVGYRQHDDSGTMLSTVGAGVSYTSALLPYNLPLELVELPSSFLERAAGEPEVVAQLLAGCRHVETGDPPPAEVVADLARAVHVSYYSPISVQISVLTSLLDQLLLLPPRKVPGAARRLWSTLTASFGLPADCAVQQLHSLPRLAAAAGQGYAYVLAAYLAEELWSGCWLGFGAAGLRSTFGVPHMDGEGEMDGYQCGEAGMLGRRIRRLLFEQGGGEPPVRVLERLLEGEWRVRGGGGVERAVGGPVIGGGGGGVLPLIRTAGGGCVPRVCSRRVRQWTGMRGER